MNKQTWLEKVTLEHSLTDVTSAVAGAVWDKFASERNNIWPQVLDVFEDRVRFLIDEKVFEAAYSIDDERVVMLEDAVEGELEFVPVTASVSIKSALEALTKKFGNLLTGSMNRAEAPKEEDMKEKLIALGLSAEAVDGMDECRQKAVLAALEGEAPTSDTPPTVQPISNSADPTPDGGPTITEQVAAGVAAAVKEIVPQAVAVALAAEHSKTQRAGHEDRLRSNGYSDEELGKMNDEAVALVCSRLAPVDFGAAAPPYKLDADDNEEMPARRVTHTPAN